MVALPFALDGVVDRPALEALGRFIAEHAEEALADTRRAERFIASVRPDLSVADEDAMRSSGEFLLAARRWLDETCSSGDSVWRRDADPAVENIPVDAVMFAR